MSQKPWFLWYSKKDIIPWVIMEEGDKIGQRAEHVIINCKCETSKGTPVPGITTVEYTIKIHGIPNRTGNTVTFNEVK